MSKRKREGTGGGGGGGCLASASRCGRGRRTRGRRSEGRGCALTWSAVPQTVKGSRGKREKKGEGSSHRKGPPSGVAIVVVVFSKASRSSETRNEPPRVSHYCVKEVRGWQQEKSAIRCFVQVPQTVLEVSDDI